MKKIIFLISFLFINAFAFSQKQMNEYTLQELTLKKKEAIAANAPADASVYETAIGYKKEIETALSAENYDKAAETLEKLKALKLPPRIDDSKTKALQAEIAKAVAAEDYEKARLLKIELNALIAGSNVNNSSTINSSSSTTIANAFPKEPTTTPITKLTKNDIYGSAVTFMGLDYSAFQLVTKGVLKLKKEDFYSKNIPYWQKKYAESIRDNKLAAWLSKTQFIADRENVENLYTKNLGDQFISPTYKPLTSEQIQKILLSYSSANHGLGLVFIQGAYDEIERKIVMHVVWFDLDSKAIVHIQEVEAKSSPTIFLSRWLTGLIDVTKIYIDNHYKKRK